jgi:hypothetical protein
MGGWAMMYVSRVYGQRGCLLIRLAPWLCGLSAATKPRADTSARALEGKVRSGAVSRADITKERGMGIGLVERNPQGLPGFMVCPSGGCGRTCCSGWGLAAGDLRVLMWGGAAGAAACGGGGCFLTFLCLNSGAGGGSGNRQSNLLPVHGPRPQSGAVHSQFRPCLVSHLGKELRSSRTSHGGQGVRRMQEPKASMR